jgi:hypothetical protein
MRRRIAGAIAAGAVAISLGLAPGAAAKIDPASCTNGGGNTPPGQQPVCQGGGLTQNPATNPAGKEPPGQQP